MLQILNNISSDIQFISQPIGWALLHSLWQAALIFVLHRLLFKRVNKMSSFQLYSPMALILVSFSLTLMLLFPNDVSQVLKDTPAVSVGMSWMTIFLWVWCAGMIFKSLQLGLDYYKIRIWRNKGILIKTGPLHTLVAELSKKMSINFLPELRLVKEITVPMVVGFFKPVLLFPACLINQLTTEELENILLHELYHVKRSDYLWNLLLCTVEVIFFFNPFVLWLIKDIRSQREISCDHAASSITQKPKALANALLRIHEINNNPKLAMALNSEGKLTERVYALMGLPMASRVKNLSWVWGLIVGLPFVLAFQQKDNVVLGDVSSVMTMDSITIPGIHHTIRSLEFKTVAGEIKEVKVNNEELKVENDAQLSAIKNEMVPGGVEANRRMEYEAGLEKKYNAARKKARSKKLAPPLQPKVNKVVRESANNSAESSEPTYNLAYVEGYQYGKSFDTLNQWEEAKYSDINWKQIALESDAHNYFLEIPDVVDDDGVLDFIVVHDDQISRDNNRKNKTESSEDLFESILIQKNLIQNTYSYSLELSHDKLIVNGQRQSVKMHKLFKTIYLEINSKNPSSKFNYQIFKNQVR